MNAAQRVDGAAVLPCCRRSVGVILWRFNGDDNQYLVSRRVEFPIGVSFVAGHDDHPGGSAASARIETLQEVSIEVQQLTRARTSRMDDRCSRQVHDKHPGHLWKVYYGRADTEPILNPAEATDARWVSEADLEELAQRTIAYAHGRLTPEEFVADPGLEPVWVLHLHALDLIDVHPVDAMAVIKLMKLGPPQV